MGLSGLGWAGIIVAIIGAALLLWAIISVIIHQANKTAQANHIWILIILGAILFIAGAVMLVFALRKHRVVKGTPKDLNGEDSELVTT